MNCYNWIPDYITNEEQFLDSKLEPLRNYVLAYRNEDISIPLFAYENRVLFSANLKDLSEILEDTKQAGFLGWECIRHFEYESHDGSISKFSIDKRIIQECFLRGWLEVNLWNRGDQKTQIIYKPPNSLIENSMSGCRNHFIHGESVTFSFKAMRIYWKKYLSLKPGKRRKRIVFFTKSHTDDNSWYVYVSPDLWRFYYGKKSDEMEEKIYTSQSDILHERKTIVFRKQNESKHAAISNFDSWQAFIHQNSEGEKSMNNCILKCFQKLQDEANKDSTRIILSVKVILKKIATQTGISGLSSMERSVIQKASNESPKIRLLVRMTQQLFIRSKIAEYFYRLDQSHEEISSKTYTMTDSLGKTVKSGLFRFVEWMSPIWEPSLAGQLITAADIPEQKHCFKMKDGEVRLYCLWRASYNDKPAYVRIKWDANISSGYEIWIVFFNPETKLFLSEIPLGTHLSGGTVIQSTRLKFDPSCERWAASVVLKRANINNENFLLSEH
ncbi:hypothetical protein MHK_009908 [Candidatus Magnetomorum sp. HK-1]|nr:hypothetical protein MHK_009908 [Candidatus Magnetomorum sp. HK-1]